MIELHFRAWVRAMKSLGGSGTNDHLPSKDKRYFEPAAGRGVNRLARSLLSRVRTEVVAASAALILTGPTDERGRSALKKPCPSVFAMLLHVPAGVCPVTSMEASLTANVPSARETVPTTCPRRSPATDMAGAFGSGIVFAACASAAAPFPSVKLVVSTPQLATRRMLAVRVLIADNALSLIAMPANRNTSCP